MKDKALWLSWGFVAVVFVAAIWEASRGTLNEKQIKAAKQKEDRLQRESVKVLDEERARRDERRQRLSAERERERRLRKSWGIGA